MNARKFAEKYVGKRIKRLYCGASGPSGIVSGYITHREAIVYEPEPDIGCYVKDVKGAVLLRKADSIYSIDINTFRLNFELELEPSNMPDDCFDCGAKGKELCKEGCPNR